MKSIYVFIRFAVLFAKMQVLFTYLGPAYVDIITSKYGALVWMFGCPSSPNLPATVVLG